MYAIEFQTKIENGAIAVPDEYRDQFPNGVRVILLSESESEKTDDFVDQLLANPLNIEGFRPLTRDDIYAR